MKNQPKQFAHLLDKSERILITSHISPDPDAISSVLLLGTTLRLNYPDKQIEMVLEEASNHDLSFLESYDKITQQPLNKAITDFKPDLFIMVDAMNVERNTRTGAAAVREFLAHNKVKQIIIDHHEEIGRDQVDLYINDRLPATAQQVYQLCFDDLKLQKPNKYAQTALLGIVADTSRFKYDNPAYKKTFRVVERLLDDGASIEALENRLERYTQAQMLVFSNLAKNVHVSDKGYTYSYIDDDFVQKVTDQPAFKTACELFTSRFMRNIEANEWGFLVYPEPANGQKAYSVSFRSANKVRDVAELAGKLGGGGHKRAAGTKGIKAKTVEEAVKKVEAVIE